MYNWDVVVKQWHKNSCLQDPTLLFVNLSEVWKYGPAIEGLKHQQRPCGTTQREKPSGECFSLHPYQCIGKISTSPGQRPTRAPHPSPQQAQTPSALLSLTTKTQICFHPTPPLPWSPPEPLPPSWELAIQEASHATAKARCLVLTNSAWNDFKPA